jgi:diadenosine tetraphosphate (Ap4A) HIT family hydrolase
LKDCVFCNIDDSSKIYEDEFFFIIRDGFPVTKLHTLFITQRCIDSYFDLTDDELNRLQKLIKEQKNIILNEDSSVTGFNIGINVGVDAGQTVMHTHIHLIPRRKGDMENPRGGVRGVIPEKQSY